jgi:hypothetical protein
MIKSVELVEISNMPLFDEEEGVDQFVRIELDGEFIMFNEEELKNAAKLAKKGLGVTFNEEYLKRLSN